MIHTTPIQHTLSCVLLGVHCMYTHRRLDLLIELPNLIAMLCTYVWLHVLKFSLRIKNVYSVSSS